MQERAVNKISPIANQPVDIWASIEAGMARDGDRAALSHLDAGFPVYLSESDTPDDAVIKQNPDGSRELVRFDANGEHTIKRLA
jgi:hypothetical protein